MSLNVFVAFSSASLAVLFVTCSCMCVCVGGWNPPPVSSNRSERSCMEPKRASSCGGWYQWCCLGDDLLLLLPNSAPVISSERLPSLLFCRYLIPPFRVNSLQPPFSRTCHLGCPTWQEMASMARAPTVWPSASMGVGFHLAGMPR